SRGRRTRCTACPLLRSPGARPGRSARRTRRCPGRSPGGSAAGPTRRRSTPGTPRAGRPARRARRGPPGWARRTPAGWVRARRAERPPRTCCSRRGRRPRRARRPPSGRSGRWCGCCDGTSEPPEARGGTPRTTRPRPSRLGGAADSPERPRRAGWAGYRRPVPGRASSVPAPATRDQADAYRFGLRRMEAALVRGDPVPLHEQIRSQRRAALVGVVLGLLGLCGSALLAAVSPQPDWRRQDVVVGADSGALYAVARGPDRLVPVANLPAARLVL